MNSMQYKKSSWSFTIIVLKVICIIGILGFFYWWGMRQEWTDISYWLGFLGGLGVLISLIISVIYSIKHSLKLSIRHHGELPSKWTGIIDRMMCGEREISGVKNVFRIILAAAGVNFRKEDNYKYLIDVNGMQFEIIKDTFRQLSEGDEVCVSYWPGSKGATEVFIYQKVDSDRAKRIKEIRRKEAFESYRRIINERKNSS